MGNIYLTSIHKCLCVVSNLSVCKWVLNLYGQIFDGIFSLGYWIDMN